MGTCIATILDWILRIIGIISLLWFLISLFIKTKEFSTSVRISRIVDKREIERYSDYREFTDPELTGEYLVFEPQDSIVKRVIIYKVKWSVKGLKKEMKLAEFKDVTPGKPLIYNTYYPEGAPSKMVEWQGDYGTKGVYILHENGKTGNVEMYNYIYHLGLIQKIRRKLDLK